MLCVLLIYYIIHETTQVNEFIARASVDPLEFLQIAFPRSHFQLALFFCLF